MRLGLVCFDTSSDVVLAWHLLVKLLRDQAAPLSRAPACQRTLPAAVAPPQTSTCTRLFARISALVCARLAGFRYFAAGSVLVKLVQAFTVNEAAPRLGLCRVRLESFITTYRTNPTADATAVGVDGIRWRTRRSSIHLNNVQIDRNHR